MRALVSLRRQIDSIDKKIIGLLNERARISLEIGKIKKKNELSTYSPDRESSVYKKVLSQNKGPLSDENIKAVYREVMSATLSLEGPMRIAYLGPVATFTHLASIKKFGSSVKYIPANSITEVFVEVENGRADYGVVPIENSIEGAVSHTLDMFIESDLKICSEVSLEISHNLLGKQVKRIPRIDKIYSNPQVFGQCRIWLEANLPNAELIEVSSTAKAAEIASKEKNSACIASSLAALCYGLKIYAKSIEDYGHNVTRFLVIGRIESRPTKNDKTSIMFSITDRVGALHDMLVPFKKNRINLTKIESRPSKKRAWDYYFFVDLEGHCQDPKVKKALKELERQATFLKVLGSYPVGNNG
ncbi:MAG: prephenate dehydratase [Candidatus Omnitrophica bacterium]|nr:prephenate dehydratase [Candidatus Omnitrophota bacterium]